MVKKAIIVGVLAIGAIALHYGKNDNGEPVCPLKKALGTTEVSVNK